ncbi:type II toxin-antitoxin system HicA family toxin [Nostoc sp. FACHB-152]|uniref:type II toxin-antitoxin system HicA family toxin n=1 Tax=unclassified Nostoc TaxID=2593658 RepID=UPI001683E527|nr:MULTISPECIES: type II toxin-antitoxin system HicA family toxin [unclassified Nostoc]MBD2447232.1 type II toxin-antitoxin system HicA family toxin [Nostoc sp. FACHB-152]MBD2468167.1 type II toxin-antitoxin system HicA family toxin [Nostoc sp. FACHB-145]
MPPFGPINRRDLIRCLRDLGFDGPYSGGKHQYMVRDELKLTIPNPHSGDISQSLLNRILRQANITREEWESL